MDPLNTFCLAALVFLSLPLPLFASAALGTFPSARRSLVPWAWGNSFVLGAAGVFLIATPLSAWIVLAVCGISFVVCGTQMFLRLARAATSACATRAGR
jgi:hypothetical protein